MKPRTPDNGRVAPRLSGGGVDSTSAPFAREPRAARAKARGSLTSANGRVPAPSRSRLCSWDRLALWDRLSRRTVAGIAAGLMLLAAGCQSPQPGAGAAQGRPRSKPLHPPIRQVVCLYEQRPWLNLDKTGDRDPEGIRYRVFLDDGAGRGVLRDGIFHVEMYRLDRGDDGTAERILVSDWHYPTSRLDTLRAKMLGDGYHLKFRWATKDLAGHEIEVITRFEDSDGRTIRSGTKRLRVPKYVS
ncbi:MAG: hypothetical protein HY763_15610 [Planctomycetes bacterium]|nr:hypothetical protein [Planctomycetota bacterium]